jgi:hypothetical protein
MGFLKPQAEDALRRSRYDVEHAVAVLVGSGIGTDAPPPPLLPRAPSQPGPFDQALAALSEAERQEIADIRAVTQSDLGTIIQVYDACNHDKQNTVSLLVSMG